MRITLKLFASLREYMPSGCDGNACDYDVDKSATVGEILDKLKIPGNLKLIILVNSVHADKEQALKEGDVMAVFPPIAGG